MIVNDVFLNKKVSLTDQVALKDAKRSLGVMLDDFLTQYRPGTADKERIRLVKEMQDEMKEVVIWRRLRDLIGSKDGAKFRKFAQSITLRILTSHANKHLGRLNDRYALLLQEGDTLELQIEDYYQAGIKRPLASLSHHSA
jgi:exonuclease SbcC